MSRHVFLLAATVIVLLGCAHQQPPPHAATPPAKPRVAAVAQAAERPKANRQDTIFFDFDSATPPESAQDTIQFVTSNAGVCNWRNVSVTGHADRSGSDEYNMGLSQRRADAVADLLAAGGVARGALEVSAKGESQPRVPTADGVRELQNRRVEIVVQQ